MKLKRNLNEVELWLKTFWNWGELNVIRQPIPHWILVADYAKFNELNETCFCSKNQSACVLYRWKGADGSMEPCEFDWMSPATLQIMKEYQSNNEFENELKKEKKRNRFELNKMENCMPKSLKFHQIIGYSGIFIIEIWYKEAFSPLFDIPLRSRGEIEPILICCAECVCVFFCAVYLLTTRITVCCTIWMPFKMHSTWMERHRIKTVLYKWKITHAESVFNINTQEADQQPNNHFCMNSMRSHCVLWMKCRRQTIFFFVFLSCCCCSLFCVIQLTWHIVVKAAAT